MIGPGGDWSWGVLRAGGGCRPVAWVTVWALFATLLAVAGPGQAPVVGQESGAEGFEEVSVAPLPASEPERVLEEPEGDFSDPPLTGGREALGAAEREIVFDPDESVRDESETTETRAVYDNVDGSRTAVISAEPVRFEEGGEWREIDLRLSEDASGEAVVAAAPSEVSFPADPVEGVAVHESPAGPITVGVPSVVESPAEGSVADGGERVPDQVVVEGTGGVDSVITPLSTGFEHDVVFASRTAAGAAFTVDIAVPDGVVATADATGVVLRDGPEVVAHYGGGVAFDATGAEEGGGETPVTTSLVGQGGGVVTVRVAIDEAWLGDPGRVFPVTVDPTYTSVIGTTPGGGDTYVNNGAPTTSYASAVDLKIGRGSDGSVYRSLVRFGLGGVPAGALIYQAEMQMVNFSSSSCTPSLVRARTATAGFGPTTTWNTQPGTGGVVSDSSFARGATGCPGGWVSMDATSAVAAWQANPASNHGIRLSADEATTEGYKRFYSSSYGSNYAPRLVVTWDRLPPVPALTSPADGARLPTLTPTLTAAPVTDPDGETVTYWFNVWTGEGLPADGQIISSGWIPSPTWTPPAAALADGVTYSWAVWARGGSGLAAKGTVSRSFLTDRRLEGDPAPTDGAGPVSVNLVTGDAAYSSASPGVSTLGGGIAPSYSYHSQVQPPAGLTGEYYVDANSNAAFDDGPPTVVRTDSMLSFDWSTVSPFDALPLEQFMVRWSGFITVPRTDTYWFGAAGSNGYKVTVNGTTVVDRWPASASVGPVYGSSMALTAGQRVPVTVDLVDSAGYGSWLSFNYKDSLSTNTLVPASWLTPAKTAGNELSPGWDLDLGGSAPVWETARVTNDAITLVAADGATNGFTRVGDGGFTSDDGSEAIVALDANGGVTVQEAGGTYSFAADGTLTSFSEGPVGDSAAPTYTWVATASGGVTYRRVTEITDPVSARSVTVTWKLPGSTCPSPPAGFDAAAPTGSLCEVSYWDGTDTRYFYKAGQLSRIVDPGGSTTDYGYDPNGRLASIRDPLAHDVVARGVRADDATALTQLTYSTGTDKATKITLPAPTAGAPRPETTFAYGTGTTDVAIAGGTNGSGYTRRVAFDASGRLTTDTDVAARTTTTEWNPAVDDEVWSTTDTTGLKTTHLYDLEGYETDGYGPVPATWFGADRRSLPAHVADVPHEHVDIDQGVNTLAARWFSNAVLTGEPSVVATGVGGAGGALSQTWATSPTGSTPFSGRFTGTITFPTAGSYGVALAKNGAGRVWIDDVLVVDGWASPGNASGTVPDVSADESRRIRVEYQSPASGTASLGLSWTPPGMTSTTVPGSALHPAFHNPTTLTSEGTTQTISYSGAGGNGPEDGQPSSETIEPDGLALATSYAYEPDGTGWGRPLTRTLPAGNTWNYSHYGGTETRNNPCTVGADPASQAGLLKTRTGPAAADGTVRIEEFVYDASGRTVATRIGTGAWTCTTYDSRGLASTTDVPAFGGAPPRIVSYDWAVGGSPSVRNNGNPLITSIEDGAGVITTTVDLLGRQIQTTDVWGAETATTYDRAGETQAVSTTAGGVTWTVDPEYRPDGSVISLDLDSDRIANVVYDNQGRLSTVAFPAGAGNAGNGTTLDPIAYDSQSRPTSLSWKGPGGTLLTSDVVTYNTAGRVTDQTIDAHDPTVNDDSFSYDGAGRLVEAVVADRDPTTGIPTGTNRTLSYEFATSGGCGPLTTGGNNTNRTALRVNGNQMASYCYDNADRLTTTTQPGYTGPITYDAHGNITAIAGEGRSYDGSDRHRETTNGATTVTYVRDALDRIVERRVAGVVTARYSYGSTDSPTAVLNGSSIILQRTIPLPGGAVYTDEGPGGAETWSYSNLHGDIAAEANASGAKQGPTRAYDSYGAPATTTVDTAPGNFDWAWLGGYQRPVEHEAGLVPTLEMGARQYDPVLGRFLEVDPVEAGSSNDYDYGNGDPINQTDLTGRSPSSTSLGRYQAAYCRSHWKRCSTSMFSLRSRARSATNKYTRHFRYTGGQANAFRHAYWMAMISKRYGVRWATGLGKAHEADTPGFCNRDCRADLKNNYVGARYGRRHYRWNDARLAFYLSRVVRDRRGGLDYGGG